MLYLVFLSAVDLSLCIINSTCYKFQALCSGGALASFVSADLLILIFMGSDPGG